MDDQMTFSDLEFPEPEEERIYQELKPSMVSALERHGIAPESLELQRNKEYYSVYLLKSNLVCRIKSGRDLSYLAIKTTSLPKYALDGSLKTSQTKTDSMAGFTRVHLSVEKLDLVRALLSSVIESVLDSVPKSFDCCSRYEECSNAKHCIHPDPVFATCCGYSRILREGRIFYGKNRNID